MDFHVEYAVYKGDSILCVGTAKECGDYLGILPTTVRNYTRPSYLERVAKRKGNRDYVTAVRLEDD